ncbi:hypothetical protein ScPMuIL_010573 [Solemya velum]
MPSSFSCMLFCSHCTTYRFRVTRLVNAGGSPPHKPLSPLAEAVQSVLGEDSEVISDLEGGIDSSLISLLQPQDDVWRRFSCLSALATGRPPYEDT